MYYKKTFSEARSKTWDELIFGRWIFIGQWPPSTRAEKTCIPPHKPWQMNLLWPMDAPVPEQKSLACHYTKLGRLTYFGRWTYFGQWTPSTIADMTPIPLHKTWQMNLLWSMDPPVPKQRWLQYQYNKLGRQTYINQWNLSVLEQRWLAYHYTKPSRWIYFGKRTPPVWEQRWFAYHYTKLGRWTYTGQWTQPAILLLQTCQMNLLWQMDPFWMLQEKVGISSYFLNN